ncbi:hypothetical protein KA183_21450, partial [bacterium]|nr:hypothetical protein [bacterium]
MGVEEEKKRLLQTERIAWFQREIPLHELVKVYYSDINDEHNHGIYCALLPIKRKASSLKKVSWDLLHGHGQPDAIVYHEGKKEIVEYLRYGNEEGIEPLVLDRRFHGIRPDHKEISEEFRLFHDLFYDKKSDEFYKFNDAGDEELIAKITENSVEIRLKEIRQFIAAKEMVLVLQFDFRESSAHNLSKLEITGTVEDKHNSVMTWGINFGNLRIGKSESFSRLLGKRYIEPLPKKQSGLWAFGKEEPDQFVEFIIGQDEHGKNIFHTSDPDTLGNNFGANSDEPHYLTPVQFKLDVLDKYYSQSGKYRVEDSVLWCGSLWSLYIDNHHDDKVFAWLGDLGRDLPYSEQLFWRAHNVPPNEKMSDTFYGRQILAKFTNSDRPEHLFQLKYRELGEASDKYIGWRILKPLRQPDQHHLHGIRLPLNNEQGEFDALVLGLTKLLIDSINERKLNENITKVEKESIKGSISL